MKAYFGTIYPFSGKLIEVCQRREETYRKIRRKTKDEFLENLISEIILKNGFFIENVKRVCNEEKYVLKSIASAGVYFGFPEGFKRGRRLPGEHVLGLCKKIEVAIIVNLELLERITK